MLALLEVAKTTFLNYNGASLYLGLFFVSLIFVFAKEDEKKAREAFFYPAILLLIVFFVPLTAEVLIRFLETNTYWRVLWILPVVPLVSYAAAKVADQQKTNFKKGIICVACIMVIIVSGNLIYRPDNYQAADNWYKLPQQVVEVSNLMRADGNANPKAVVADTLVSYIRQYDPGIRLAYGRDVPKTVGGYGIEKARNFSEVTEEKQIAYDLYEEMHNEQPDIERFLQSARSLGCNYIVVTKDSPLVRIFENPDYQIQWVGATDEYIVYHDDFIV